MKEQATPVTRRLLTYREFAEALGVSERTVFEWVADGAVQPARLGRKIVRFSVAELERVSNEGISSAETSR